MNGVQTPLFSQKSDWKINEIDSNLYDRKPPKQLLKWVGNKQRFAQEIASIYPNEYGKYIEPFIGSGAVLGALAPNKAIAGDAIGPLIELWKTLQDDPADLLNAYTERWVRFNDGDRKVVYREILDAYNDNPNPLDFVFLSRSCYGGIVRFTKEGRMSTPVGPHNPISPESFKERMMLWRPRVINTDFMHKNFVDTMRMADKGDIVYCDPPYVDSQKILYGAQGFSLKDLWEEISECKKRGALVALSIDGRKKSGKVTIDLGMPDDLFEREMFINLGSSMLRRLQKSGETMINEDVQDRLLLTW
jgi:DNA adenine methylase